MVKKKRKECMLCDKPLVYCGDGRPSKYCPSCATKQQKGNSKIARQIRIIKKRIKILWEKTSQNDDIKDIKKLYYELEKLDKKKEEQKIQKLEVKKEKITSKEKEMKIKSKENEIKELMLKQLKYKYKREKAETELEGLNKS
jgi:hypothetical protein